jgi:hypothetical protein
MKIITSEFAKHAYNCPECGDECKIEKVDEGHGSYECHGHKGTHHDYHYVSNCCRANMDEHGDTHESDEQDAKQEAYWQFRNPDK